MTSKEFKLEIIKAGEAAVKELIKVARDPIFGKQLEGDISADRLKNAAAAKKLAIMDAFEILTRIEEEKNAIEASEKGVDPKMEKVNSNKGFAERFSKDKK